MSTTLFAYMPIILIEAPQPCISCNMFYPQLLVLRCQSPLITIVEAGIFPHKILVSPARQSPASISPPSLDPSLMRSSTTKIKLSSCHRQPPVYVCSAAVRVLQSRVASFALRPSCDLQAIDEVSYMLNTRATIQ